VRIRRSVHPQNCKQRRDFSNRGARI